MKIYEIGTGYTPIPAQMGAATEIVVEELTKSMQNMTVDVSLIDIQAQKRLDNQLPIMEVRVPKMFSGTDVQLGLIHKLKRVTYSCALAMKLKKILKKAEERVVLHFHNQYNLFFFLKIVPQSLQRKAHIAYTVHSYIWHGDWNEIETTVRNRYFQECCCIERADSVFVLNERTRMNIVQHLKISEEKVHLINNGVNTQVYYPMTSEEIRSVKSNLGMEKKKVFVQVGSVCQRKNQLQAVKLLLPLMKKDQDIVYCYAGGIISEEYQEEILRFVRQNEIEGQVRYFGELIPGKKLNEFYNIAEAMIFPSQAEGFSLVIVEAMAAGTPVFISNELKFMLADKCIRYASAQEFEALLKREIGDVKRRNEISGQIREIIVDDYSWDVVTREYCKVWGDEEDEQ